MKSILIAVVALFFTAGVIAADKPGLGVELLAKDTRSWDGASLPAYKSGQPEVSIVKVSIPPGMTLSFHKHPMINVGYLVSGKLTVVTDAEEVLNMEAGDTIIEVVDKYHYGRNDGDEDAVIVVFYAGVEGEPLSIKRP